MKKQLLSVFAVLTLCFSASAQTTVTITATGTAGSYNTGSVNSAGAKNDGDMININSTTNVGWAKFDMTSIPSSAIIMSANCAFTTFTTTSSGATNNLYGFVGDPSVITGTTLYTDCTSGTSFNASTWTANATNTKTLNATGVSFIQTNVTSNQLCISYVRGSTNNYNIYGYGAAAGQQPMLVVTYSVPPGCAGAPTPGTIVATSTMVCSGTMVNFSLSGSTVASGLTYQWQSSPNGVTFSAVTSATNPSFSSSVASDTYYNCIVACGSNTAITSDIMIGVVSNNTYATVPFLEAFDNVWQNRCDNQNVPVTANWASNPTTGNDSWRRQDAGSTAAWTSPTTAVVAPMGTGCANFHSYYAPASTSGDLDVFIDMGTTSNYEMSFYRFNNSGADSLEVWLSTDGGSTFTKKGGYNVATTWTKEVINFGAVNSASCIIRFHGISDYGNDDLAFDSLKVYTAVCSTPPVAGVISGPTSVTNGSVNSYTISPATGNIQWYSATNINGPYSPIVGANTASNQTITATGSGTVYYGVIASNTGCPNDTSNVSYAVTVIFPGDDVCSAIPLTLGVSTTSYSPFGATTQTNEVVPPGTGCSTNSSWCNTTLNNSLWFSFVAPASGNVTVQSPDFDSQLAVWKAAACSDLLSASTATLIAANDDDANYSTDNGVQYSSFVSASCLTPGMTYYIQLDTYGAAASTDSTRVLVMDMGSPLDASFTGLAANYCTIDPASTLTPATTGGLFTLGTSTTSITQFDPSVGVGTYTVNYAINGCMTSSVTMVSVCSGIKDITSANGINVYPNPTNGVLNISISKDLAGASFIEVYDAIGKLAIKETLTNETTTINTSKLENGMYVFKVINNNQAIKVGKIVKQ